MAAGVLAAAGLAVFTSATTANAEHAAGSEPDNWTRSAEETAPDATPKIALRDASGATWAPGGAASSNSVNVSGKGLHVNSATVTYNQGTNLGNACVDEYEIAYYEGGARKVDTSGQNCALWRTTHKFDLNKDLDAGSQFCGRVKVAGQFGNYACIEIKE